MNWAEPLPKNCPPEDSVFPDGLFYRVIENSEPCEFDFYSHRKRDPDKKFNASECRARSLSVFDRIESCQKVRLLPLHKNKEIIEIELSESSGAIKRTGHNQNHFSWWLANDFNPFEFCRVV